MCSQPTAVRDKWGIVALFVMLCDILLLRRVLCLAAVHSPKQPPARSHPHDGMVGGLH